MADALNIGTLIGSIELEDNFSPALGRIDNNLNMAANRVAMFGDRISGLGTRLQSSGRFVGAMGDRLSFLTIALGVGTKQIVDYTATFQTNMTKVVTIAGVAEESMRQFRSEILQLGPAVGRGPVELSEALYSIASVGMRGAEAMEILDRSARASAVGLGHTEDIAQAVVSAMTAYGKENLSAAQATDMLLAAVREGGAEADQFAHTLGRVVGTAKQVGIGFDEVVSSVATFTRVGVRADEAVTALRGTIAFLMKPSVGARETLLSLGTSIEEVRDKVKKDGLADALIELVRLTEGNEDALGKIIPNVRALAGVLANTGEQASAYKEILRVVRDSHGDLDEAFERTSENIGFRWEKLKARIGVVALQIGDELEPALARIFEASEPIFDAIVKIVTGFSMLPEPVQTATIALLGITLLSGPFMSFAGRFIEIVGMMIGPKGLGGLITWLTSYTTALNVNTVAVEANAAANARAAAATAASLGFNATTVVSTAAMGGVAAIGPKQTPLLKAASKDAEDFAVVIEHLDDKVSYLFGKFATGENLVPLKRGFTEAAAAARVAASDIGLTNTQLLLTGETAGVAGISLGRFAGLIRGAGIVALIAAIGGALYDLSQNWETYTAPFRVWLDLQMQVATALRDLISAISEVIGLTDILSTTWDQLKNVYGGVLNIVEDVVSIFNSSVTLAINTVQIAIYDLIEVLQNSFRLAWEGLIEIIEDFTGVKKDDIVNSMYVISAAVLMAIQPLRDFVSILAFLQTKVPQLSEITGDAAALMRELANRSERELAARQTSTSSVSMTAGLMTQPKGGDPWKLDTSWMPKAKLDLFGIGEGFDRVTLGARTAKDPLGLFREESERLAKDALAPLSAELQKIVLNYHLAGRSASQIAEHMGLNEGAVQKVIEAYREAARATKEQDEATASLRAALVPLTADQEVLARQWLEQGVSTSTIAKSLNVSADAVRRYKDELDDAAKLSETLTKAQIGLNKEISEWSEQIADRERKGFNDFAQNILEQVKAQEQFEIKNRQSRLRGTALALDQIEVERNAELRKYEFIGKLTDDLKKQINDYYDHQVALATGSADTIIERMDAIGFKTDAMLEEMMNNAHRDFMQMAASGQYSADVVYQAWLRYFELWGEWSGHTKFIEDQITAFTALGNSLENLGDAIGGIGGDTAAIVGQVVNGVGQIALAWAGALKAIEQYRKAGGATLGEKIGAIAGGVAGVIGATNEGSTAERGVGGAVSGAMAGLQIGAAFAPQSLGLSLAIGALAGGLTGLLRGVFGLTEYEKRVREAAKRMQELRKEALETYGSFDKLRLAAHAVGIDIRTAFNSTDPEFLQATLEDLVERTNILTEAMERYNLTWADLGDGAALSLATTAADELLKIHQTLTAAGMDSSAATRAMSDDLNDFIGNALRAGIGIPPALAPIIRSLIEMGLLTENNARLMLGMAEQNLPTWDELKAAAERYGASVEGLGQVAEQIRLGDIGETLAADFDIFTRAGVDMTKIIEIMGDDFADFVQDAIRHGASIPEALKPLAEAMIEAGLLVDENGDKLTDISQIEFTKPLTQLVDELIRKLDELIEKFLEVGNTQVPPVNIPWQWHNVGGERPPHDPDIDLEESGGDPQPLPMAAGGDFIVDKPTLFLAGEAGIERATFSGAGRTTHPHLQEASGELVQHITFQLGDEVVARHSARGMPKVMKIYGR